MPWVSPMTWTSTWRGASRYRSKKTSSEPKAAAASRWAAATASTSSALAHEAHAAAATAGRRLDEQGVADGGRGGAQRVPSAPGATTALGRTGTPASPTSSLARALCPMTRMASGDGPTQTMPAAAQASGRSGFSDRKP